MKTENTPENKLKFIANYWGQLALCYKGYNQPTPVDLLNIVREGDFLSLRSISSLTDEEKDILFKLCGYSYNPKYFSVNDFSIEITKQNNLVFIIDDLRHIVSNTGVDYLRSIGILIPWMDLSVEDIKAYGWAKEATL